MKWQEFIHRMEKWDQMTIDPKSFLRLKHATPITPKEYLAFADKDLLQGNTHGLVNALSNTKLAINCQITSLLTVLGMENAGELQTKLKQFEEIGILVPRVNKKIKALETLLERQFSPPSIDEVEDAIDTATLFIEATEKVFQEFMDSWWVTQKGGDKQNGVHRYKEGNKTFILKDDSSQASYSDGLYIHYNQESGDYGIWGYLEGKEVFEAEVTCGSALDIELIKCSVLTTFKATDSELKDLATKFVSAIKATKGAGLNESLRAEE